MPSRGRSLVRARPGAVAAATSAAGAMLAYAKRNPAKAMAVAHKVGRQLGKYRKRYSRTDRRGQQHFEYSKIKEGHGDITFSKFRKVRKPKSKLEKKLASVKGKISRRYLESFETKGLSGYQQMQTLTFFEREHLRKIVDDNWLNQSSTEGGRPIDWTTNTAVSVSAGGDATRNDLTPYLHKSDHCLTVTNFENVSATVTIFDLLCKKDTDTAPHIAVRQGMQTAGEVAESAVDQFQIGIHPTHSRVFNERWKIEKATQLTMKPGENHKHFIDIDTNQLVSSTRLQEAGTKAYLGGVTRAILIVAEGVLIGSNAAGQDAVVSTAPTTLGLMWLRRYVSSLNQRKHVVSYASPPLPVIPVANQRAVQEDGDIIQPGNV